MQLATVLGKNLFRDLKNKHTLSSIQCIMSGGLCLHVEKILRELDTSWITNQAPIELPMILETKLSPKLFWKILLDIYLCY